MRIQRSKKEQLARRKQIPKYLATINDKPVSENEILYMASIWYEKPVKAQYIRNGDTASYCWLSSIFLPGTNTFVDSTVELSRILLEHESLVEMVVCKTYEEAVSVRNRLLNLEVAYISSLDYDDAVWEQHFNTNRDHRNKITDEKYQQALQDRIDEGMSLSEIAKVIVLGAGSTICVFAGIWFLIA